MIIYNVLIICRYCDPIIHNFTSLVDAFNFARGNALEYNSDFYEEKGYNPEKDNGWILMISNSCDGDYVRVSQSEVIV